MKYILVTNNDSIISLDYKNIAIEYYDCSLVDVLIKARDYIHKGHKLLSHPLSSSLKPNETPYKSILIGGETNLNIDCFSVGVIESSIEAVKKFPQSSKSLNQNILSDFKLVDKTVIESAILNNL